MIDHNLMRGRVAALIAGERWPYAVAVLWAWCRNVGEIEKWLSTDPALLWCEPDDKVLMCHPNNVEESIGEVLGDIREAKRKSHEIEVAAGARLQTDTIDFGIAKELEARAVSAALGQERPTNDLAWIPPWDKLRIALQRGEVSAYGLRGLVVEGLGPGRNFAGKPELIPAAAWLSYGLDMNKSSPGSLLLVPENWRTEASPPDIHWYGSVTFDAASVRKAMPPISKTMRGSSSKPGTGNRPAISVDRLAEWVVNEHQRTGTIPKVQNAVRHFRSDYGVDSIKRAFPKAKAKKELHTPANRPKARILARF
ncbi:MAG: hypothetical protein RJA87_1294 [Pseudomonadota bacterium]|jgi:hypothetical protein